MKGKVGEAPATVPIRGYVPPKVEVGQVVLWTYWTGDARVSPAVVLAAGGRTLNLAVHVDGLHDHMIKTGVRHVTDPFLQTSPEHESGVWRLTPRDERLDALLGRFEGTGEGE